jgi:antitoxin VapB
MRPKLKPRLETLADVARFMRENFPEAGDFPDREQPLNPQVRDLGFDPDARQVAAETGESLTEAIIHALEERLKSRRSVPGLAETLIAIGRRCSSLPDLDTRELDEIIGYDEARAFR